MSAPLLDAKTSLKKILSNVDYLESLNKDYIPKLKELPKNLLETIQKLEDDLNQVEFHLENLVDYAINYFKNLKEKYRLILIILA